MTKEKKGKNKKAEKPMTLEMMQMANAKLLDYIQSQNFGSLEEINDFVSKNVNGKRIDEIVPEKTTKKSDIEKSDDLMYEAYEASPAKARKLVLQALKLNPENVRALTFMGDEAGSEEDTIKFYKQAMDAGSKQLGEQYFKENKGHFWGMNETRPFMTAKLNYANTLAGLDKSEEAAKEYAELIELNPNDNQGVRYNLAGILLYHKNYAAYLKLYTKFKNEYTANWLFNYALLLFATEGPTPKANKALIEANKQNAHVLMFMTQRKKITADLDEGFYSPGDEREAAYYLLDNFKNWMDLPDSVEWILTFMDALDRKN